MERYPYRSAYSAMRSATQAWAFLCAFLLLAGVLFWPTLYRYEQISLREGGETLVRIHRLTGKTAVFYQGRWLEDRSEEVPQLLPLDEVAKITGNAGFGVDGTFYGRLYNGSQWTITSVTLKVMALGPGKKLLWRRMFAEEVHIRPLTTGSFSFEVVDYGKVVDYAWHIEMAHGYPPRFRLEPP